MRLSGAAQAELIRLAAYGLLAVAVVIVIKKTLDSATAQAQEAAQAVSDAVDSIRGEVVTVKDAMAVQNVTAPTSPAGVVGWIDSALVAITNYAKGLSK